MATSLINLLQTRTVLVRAGKAVGTGSLIAPGKVLTCAHVVRKAIESQERIEVYLPNPIIPGQSVWTEEVVDTCLSAFFEEEMAPEQGNGKRLLKTEYPDVAILEINRTDHEILKIPDFKSNITHARDQQFLAFGFQKKDRDLSRNVPQAVSLNYSGEQIDGVIRKLMFSNGLIRPGMSGAPLMNWETAEVIGLIHMTMSPNDDLGAIVIPLETVWNVFELWNQEGKSRVFQVLNSAEHKNKVKKQYRQVFPKFPILKEYGWKIIALPIILFFALWWLFFHRGPIEESSLIAISFVVLAFVGNLLGDGLGLGVSKETSKMKSQLGSLIFNKYVLFSLAMITLGFWLSFSSVWIHGNSQYPSVELALYNGDKKLQEGSLDPKGSTRFTFFASPFGDSLTLKAGDREPIHIKAKSLFRAQLYYPADFLLEPLILIRFDGYFKNIMHKYQIEVTIEKMNNGELVKEIPYIDTTMQGIGSVLIGNRKFSNMPNTIIDSWKQSIENRDLKPEIRDKWLEHWQKVRKISVPESGLDLGDRIRIKVIKKSTGKILNDQRFSIQEDFTDKYLLLEL